MKEFDPKKIERIELASQSKIDQFQEYVDAVLEALGHPEALVTDESKIWDFYPFKEGREDSLKKLSDKLGFQITTKDYIWEIAEQLRAKRWADGI